MAGLLHLVEAMHAGGGLLGDALDARGDRAPELGLVGDGATEKVEHDRPFLGVVVGGRGDLAGALELGTLVDQQGGVATVVEDHVGAAAIGPAEDLLGAPPVLVEGLALPREHGHALGTIDGALGSDHHGGGGVVLGGEDVAARPPHVGAERHEGLDEHGGLDRHVQRSGDPGPGQRLGVGELGPQRHQARHLMLGELDLLAAEASQGQIGDLVVDAGVGHGSGERHDVPRGRETTSVDGSVGPHP